MTQPLRFGSGVSWFLRCIVLALCTACASTDGAVEKIDVSCLLDQVETYSGRHVDVQGILLYSSGGMFLFPDKVAYEQGLGPDLQQVLTLDTSHLAEAERAAGGGEILRDAMLGKCVDVVGDVSLERYVRPGGKVHVPAGRIMLNNVDLYASMQRNKVAPAHCS